MYQHPGNRPIFINLMKLRLPLNAWLSVAHRISGLGLFITLLGYLALLNLLLINHNVTLMSVQDHWIVLCLHSVFWSALSFHWLTGLRHLLAEHFTSPKPYKFINSAIVSQALLLSWLVLLYLIMTKVWLS